MCPVPLFNLLASVCYRVPGGRKAAARRPGLNEDASASAMNEHTFGPEWTEPKKSPETHHTLHGELNT